MNKFKLFIILIFLIAFSGGCSAFVTDQPDSFITATVQSDLTAPTETVTSIPSSRLQITFIRNRDNYAEFFGVDISCVENDRLCFGEPTLLFKTLPVSSNDHNKPKGRIRSYSWSPGGDEIVLSANKDLFIGDMNTKEWKNITNSSNVEEYDPTWSRDRRYIYYLACTQDETSMGSCKFARLDLVENANVFLLNSVEDSIAAFAVSPDNQSVVFSISEGFGRLYRSDLIGSKIEELTANDLEETSPSFSYDGNLIAFVRTNRPVMVADSKLESDVVLQNSSWNDEKILTDEFEGEAGSPVFSYDEKWVAFDVFDADNHFNIYVASIGQGTVIQVTRGNDDEVSPSWRLFRDR